MPMAVRRGEQIIMQRPEPMRFGDEIHVLHARRRCCITCCAARGERPLAEHSPKALFRGPLAGKFVAENQDIEDSASDGVHPTGIGGSFASIQITASVS